MNASDLKSSYTAFLVICNDDSDQPIKRVLATRQTFTDYEAAERYAGSIAKTREPEIIGCPQALTIVRGQSLAESRSL